MSGQLGEQPSSIKRVAQTKTLETYRNAYIVEERGWRVRLSNTGSIETDRIARLLAAEADVQTLLHLAHQCGTSKDADLPEIDARRLRRPEPYRYEIATTAPKQKRTKENK